MRFFVKKNTDVYVQMYLPAVSRSHASSAVLLLTSTASGFAYLVVGVSLFLIASLNNYSRRPLFYRVMDRSK